MDESIEGRESSDDGQQPSARAVAEPDQPNPRAEKSVDLSDLSAAASDRIRRFVANSTVRGGASPSDVADLYTAPEIAADERATSYLDRRYVAGEMPADWRQLQDDLTAAHFDAPPGTSGESLLARLDRSQARAERPRSIFDDPEDDEDEVEDRGETMTDRDPTLEDLMETGRQAIERHLLAEVLCYGTPPVEMMRLREMLHAAGDDRSLQYLELPFENGERPADWDELRDRALRLRGRLEARGRDSAEAFRTAEAAHPELDARGLLGLLEDEADRR